MYELEAGPTFRKQYKKLNKKEQKRVLSGLEPLKDNPFSPRSSADIKPIAGTKPQKHRIRIGGNRIIYFVDKKDKIVQLIELFSRGRGYRNL